MKERYIPIRPGIAEHLLRGDISAFEFGVYVLIHLQADYSTGIWHGSAPRIVNSAPRGARLREVQRALEHLTDLGLLKPFHKHGQRGNFPFLINKFTVRAGALKGMRLNADKSESWRQPTYEPCADNDADDSGDVRAQGAPIQEVRNKREKGRKKPAAKTTPLADPRFHPFFSYAYESYKAKHQRAPIWTGKDSNALRNLLRGKSPEALPLELLNRLWNNYSVSTDPFTVRQRDSLAYFCSNPDKFSDGPILERSKPNGSYADKTSTVETTLSGFRQLQQARTH